MAQQKFGEIVISGQTVDIFKVVSDRRDWFCSYVTLKNSAFLNESVLFFPTFREGNKIGFDTAHICNEGQTEAQQLMDAIRQAVNAINRWKEIMEVD